MPCLKSLFLMRTKAAALPERVSLTVQSRNSVGALKMEVLKTLVLLFSAYKKQMQPAASLILQSCWSLLTDSFMLYQGTVIESASSDDGEVRR